MINTSLSTRFRLIAVLAALSGFAAESHAARQCQALFRSEATISRKAVVPGERIVVDVGPRLTDTSIVYLGKYGGEHRGIVAGSHDLMVVISDATAERLNLDSKGVDFPAIQKQTEADNCLPTAIAYVQGLAAPRDSAVVRMGEKARAAVMTPFMAPSRLDPFGLSRVFPAAGAWVRVGQETLINVALANAGVKYREVHSTEEVIEALDSGKKVLIGASVNGDIMRIYNEQGESTHTTVAVPSDSGHAGHAMVALKTIPAEGGRIIQFADPASGELVAVKDTDHRVDGIRLAYVIE